VGHGAPFEPGETAFWHPVRESVRVLERSSLWGSETALVHRPATGEVVRISGGQLSSASQRTWEIAEISWRAAACRALALMANGHIAAARSEELIPLPHQIAVVEYALARRPIRLLLADEVGLGKTIEAGMIIRELLDRGHIARVLIVAPKGVQLQWIAEMRRFFEEAFVHVGPSGVPTSPGFDPWRSFDRVVCSVDAVKPLRIRAGWDDEQIDEHNRARFDAIVEAGWDLVIFDEAHHVAGATEDVARHQLALALADRSPHLLLLSATPHSGKSDAFSRLLGLIDIRFRKGEEVTKEAVAPIVLRNAKRRVVDEAGRPLFRERTTLLEVIPYQDRRIQKTLYEAVTDYVRHGYDRTRRDGRRGHEFLVLLMQRLVSSSTAAIGAALERRAIVLADQHAQLRLFSMGAEEWSELSGEEQFGALSDARAAAWGDERAEVELLVDLARRARAEGIDAKAQHLLEMMTRLAIDERNPSLKVVVFTEFVPTQEMLIDVLEGAGIPTAAINGSMSLDGREAAQHRFGDLARVLVSTDAGGEGINLQFAHVVVNYDLPWNPMRIEQRIGRVDRIGQTRPVRAFNLTLESSVDERVLTVLQAKLDTIRAELGVDKTNDVLESASRRVEDVYAGAIVEPAGLEQRVDEVLDDAAQDLLDGPDLNALIEPPPVRSQRASGTVPDLLAKAASARVIWSDGQVESGGELPIDHLPEVLRGEAVPVVSGTTPGWWSVWEIQSLPPYPLRDCAALFVSDEGLPRPDLAESHWVDAIDTPALRGTVEVTRQQFDMLRERAIDHAYRPGIDTKTDVALIARLILRVEP
jgi:superfamily II DNA or RNA helicase